MEQLSALCGSAEKLLADMPEISYETSDETSVRRLRGELARLRSSLDERRGYLRRTPDGSGEHTRSQLERALELSKQIEARLAQINEYLVGLEAYDRRRRRLELRETFDEHAKSLGILAEEIWKSPAFRVHGWDDPRSSIKRAKRNITDRVERIARELAMLQAKGGRFAPALLAYYLETLSLDGLESFYRRLELTSSDDLGIEATPLVTYSELGAPYSEDFVAFDLEFSGSDPGEAPSDIIEFGAVKYRNGELVERFSQLCNPGKSVTKVVTGLTGITDAMLKSAPSVSEALESFLEFVGELPLVGHGASTSDMLFLRRATEHAELSRHYDYYDTLTLAGRLGGFEKLNLKSLAKTLSVTIPPSHRALSDAECTAEVYLRLARMARE